jgi:parallel beta-helix repeat protein
MRSSFETIRPRTSVILAVCVTCLLGLSSIAAAGTLCVNPKGSQGCFATIKAAVNHAKANDIINVGAGTYKEEVEIGIPLSLIGAGTNSSVINATGFAHGIFVNGFGHPGLHDVTIAGFTVSNALFEGVLVVSATDVTIRNNRMINNDKSSGLQFTGAFTGCPNQPGSGTYETDETGDCGGALHLVGTSNSTVSDNVITGNADGVLISDETAESQRNLLIHNIVQNNPLECGIVLASHPPSGQTSPPFAPHHGVDRNTIADNLSANNGIQVGGAGVGLFSDGAGPGRVSGNVIIGNRLTNNGLGGVTLHTHVGPAFHLPADNMDGNMIIGNVIAGNLADTFDTATPGRGGININSGQGGTAVRGTVISRNTIRDEDVDIAINDPAQVDIHLNNLLGGQVGVEDVCAFDGASVCTGGIDATENFWGCPAGPGGALCTTASGSDIRSTPWLKTQLPGDDDDTQKE